MKPEADAPFTLESADDLFHHAPCGYLYVHPAGGILQCNRTFLSWTGFSASGVTALRFTQLLTAGGRIFFETNILPILRVEGAVSEVALDIVCRDGGRFPGLINFRRKADALGSPLLDRITVFNATDRRRYEAELLQARMRAEDQTAELQRAQDDLLRKNSELLELHKQKDRLLGMVAHDLRNPLTVIGGFSDLLLARKDRLDPARVARSAQMIKSSADFMLHLVNELLDIATIESGHIDLRLEPTSLGSLIEENLAVNRLLSEKKEIGLVFAEEGAGREVLVDRARLHQVMNNLVSNACKFSPPGTTVQVSLVTAPDHVTICVRDQGPGIPRAELDNLFKPFGRTSVRSTGGEPSTGLGLAIVQKVVTAHKGRIWAGNAPGQGAEFCVALPG